MLAKVSKNLSTLDGDLDAHIDEMFGETDLAMNHIIPSVRAVKMYDDPERFLFQLTPQMKNRIRQEYATL